MPHSRHDLLDSIALQVHGAYVLSAGGIMLVIGAASLLLGSRRVLHLRRHCIFA